MSSPHFPGDTASELSPNELTPSMFGPGDEHYRQLMQCLPAAVYVCDMQGRIKLFNESAVELWGRRPAIGRDLWCGSLRIYLPDGTPLAPENCPMAMALRERHESCGYEILIERPDGSRRNVLPFPRLIRDRAGKAVGAVNMLVDITEIKRTETALKETAEAAKRSKERFLAVPSHELRTPLTPVAMAAAALAGHADLPPCLRDEVEMIRRNIDIEINLIDDLLDLGRITGGKLLLQAQTLDVNDAVRHVCGICRGPILDKHIQLHCDLAAEADKVNADPPRLRQILWNVLKNAVKFTPDGGDIYVATANSGGCVRITIRDTGIGIAADKLPGVFAAFEQGGSAVRRQFGGLGLGLAISKAWSNCIAGKFAWPAMALGRVPQLQLRYPNGRHQWKNGK